MICRSNDDGDECAFIFNSGFPGKAIVVYEDAYGELSVRRVTHQTLLENLTKNKERDYEIDPELKEFIDKNKRSYYDSEPKYQK